MGGRRTEALMRSRSLLVVGLVVSAAIVIAAIVVTVSARAGGAARVATSSEQAKRQAEALLRETPIGREAMRRVTAGDVTVVYWRGPGSSYLSRENEIWIEWGQSPEELAGTFVHEAQHARSPGVPDPQTMPRDAYVDAALLEEARCAVLEIRHNQQLRRVRAGVTRLNLQREYEGAYAMAVLAENNARFVRGQPVLDPAREERVGAPAGLARVLKAFHDREARTSSSEGKEDYVQVYERAWDEAN